MATTITILDQNDKQELQEHIDELNDRFDIVPSETVVGKNLLNLNAAMPDSDDVYSGGFLRGKLFDDEGVISGNSAACITDYIPVQEGSYILCTSWYSGEQGNMVGRRWMGYDEDKNLIGLLVSSRYYATPTNLSGVAYVRIQLTTTYADAQGQIEYAAGNMAWTDYEEYTETVIPGGHTLNIECMPPEFIEQTKNILATNKARFDGRFNYVAYSAINGIGKDQNSREFFEWAAKKEFTALKGDMRITSDGKLVMCHDAGFTLDDAGLIAAYDSTNATAIHDMTEAECLALQYARYGGTICGFEEYVRICKKYGKIAYITIREEYTDEVVPEMMRVLRKYGMVKQCIVSGYPSATPLQAVREADPTIMLAYVLGHNADITTADIDLAISLGNMLICGFHFSTTTDDVGTKLAGSLEAIEYAHANDIRVYECQVHTMDIADKLLEYGITGAQIMFNPTFE